MALPTATPKSSVASARADEERPVPEARASAATPILLRNSRRHRAEDEREQQQHEGGVEAGEDRGVGLREGGEQGAAEGHQPDLVAVPQRADGVHRDPPLARRSRAEAGGGCRRRGRSRRGWRSRRAGRPASTNQITHEGLVDHAPPPHAGPASSSGHRVAVAGQRPRPRRAGPRLAVPPDAGRLRPVLDLAVEHEEPDRAQREVDQAERRSSEPSTWPAGHRRADRVGGAQPLRASS